MIRVGSEAQLSGAKLLLSPPALLGTSYLSSSFLEIDCSGKAHQHSCRWNVFGGILAGSCGARDRCCSCTLSGAFVLQGENVLRNIVITGKGGSVD